MKKKVLIVEDNLEFAQTMFNYIKENNKYVEILGMALDGYEALDYLREDIPDIIILDLQMPKLNGIGFLNKIKKLKTDIFIISGEREFINQIDYEYFDKIRKVYVKPFSISQLNDDLNNICYESKTTKIKDMINKELLNFNFNRGTNGYLYLIECIEKSIKEPQILRNMEGELFPYISKKLNIDDPKYIKWSLQKLMKSMSRYTNSEIISDYFIDTRNPTLKVFITTIDDKIIEKLKEA